MVTIVDYKKRETQDGKEFFVLELQSGIEMVKSRETGKYYATVRKTSIPTTFDEQTCSALVGTKLNGTIVKQECEPYEYTIQETGEVITLHHHYVYVQENEQDEKVKLYSQEGVLEATI